MTVKRLLLSFALALCAVGTAHALDYWTYWGIAPDGVTVLQSDDFGLIADSNGRYGAITDGKYVWTIINGHFYYRTRK
jgi:hypothetical protein